MVGSRFDVLTHTADRKIGEEGAIDEVLELPDP
jgi:hypothetical protein